MSNRDYYEILGVGRTASDDELKAAFRKLARQYHPDVSKEADAEERFKEINEAYGVLSDADKRARYDRFGKEGLGNMRLPRLHSGCWRHLRGTLWAIWFLNRTPFASFPAPRPRLADAGHIDV